MRPTDLKFRSPKEKTPDPYDAPITSNGVGLFQKVNRKKSNFALAKRFHEITGDNISFWRGPGSYDLSYESIGKKKLKGTPVYRPLYRGNDVTNNAYYYVGNQIVYDPYFANHNKSHKGSLCSVDPSFGNKSRPTTASSKNYSPAIRRFMSPQPEDMPNRPGSTLRSR
jgi:hypothetical protein